MPAASLEPAPSSGNFVVRFLIAVLVSVLAIFIIGVLGTSLLIRSVDNASKDRACPNSSDRVIAAAAAGDASAVAEAIRDGWDPNTVDHAANSALACAVPLGHADVVTALLDAGADPDTVARDGDSVLADAARFCQPKAAAALLEGNANPDSADRHDVAALQQAIDHGDEATVGALLEAGADTQLLLHGVAIYGLDAERGERCPVNQRFDEDFAALLLEHGVPGQVVLSRAVLMGGPGAVTLALAEGADPNVGFEDVVSEDYYSIPLFMLFMTTTGADGSGQVHSYAVQHLHVVEHGGMEFPDIDEGDVDPDQVAPSPSIPRLGVPGEVLERPPLLAAAFRGDHRIVTQLLEAGADPNRQSTGGYTALHAAAVCGGRTVYQLLEDAGAVAPAGVISPEDLALKSDGWFCGFSYGPTDAPVL